MARRRKPSCYAVHLPAHARGVYRTWEETKRLVEGHSNRYKGFQTYEEASRFSQMGPPSKRNNHRSPEYREPLAPIGYCQQRMPPPARPYDPRVKSEYQSSRSSAVARQPATSAREPEGESIGDVEDGLAKYYAVARGRKPGLYESWLGPRGAQVQTNKFSGAVFKGFDGREEAIAFMCANGIARSEILLFRTAFKQMVNFEPEPTASFKDEFDRYASSQGLNRPARNKAKVDAIHDSLIHYCLPSGVMVDQEDPEEGIILTSAQTLTIYQTTCQLAAKAVHGSINQCLIELNDRLFVNIIDFIDSYRTRQGVPTFQNWKAFVKYTFDSRTINLEYARKNEFLAPLLQDLSRGPGAFNQIFMRNRLIEERDERIRDREQKAREKREREQSTLAIKREVMSTIPEEPSLSPPASEFSPSPSPSSARFSTPELEPSALASSDHNSDYEADNNYLPIVKREHVSPERDIGRNFEQNLQELQGLRDRLNQLYSSDGLPPSSQVEERHLTQATQLGKRAYEVEIETQNPSPRKRKRRTQLEMLSV